MRNLFVLLALSLITLFSSAQGQTVDMKIKAKLKRIERLGEASLPRMSESEKHRLDDELSDVLSLLRGGILSPNPGPINPPGSNLFCKWMTGNDSGISRRGYHLLEEVRGFLYSHDFYGNNNIVSKTNCHQRLIQETVHPSLISVAKRTTCSCDWFPADKHHEPLDRGYHMTYQLEVPGENGPVALTISSGYYGNNSTPSRESCNRALIGNNFVCN